MGKKILGIALIGGGVIGLFNVIIMAAGGMEIMVGLFFPLALSLAPTDEVLMAWVEVPLSMQIEGILSNVQSFKEDGILGGGSIDFQVTMSGIGPDSAEAPVVPALYIQEDAEIDEKVRYVINGGPLNYMSIFFWLCAFGSLGLLGFSIIYKLSGSKKSDGGGIERGASAPPATTVQVIALDDTAFKE